MEEILLPEFKSIIYKSIVENLPLERVLNQFNVPRDTFLRYLGLSSYSSEDAKRVVFDEVKENLGTNFRSLGLQLYLVKRVLCHPTNYDLISEIISDEDTDKFKVIRLIGNENNVIGAGLPSFGLETQLVLGLNPKSAINSFRKDSLTECLPFDLDKLDNSQEIRKADQLLTRAIYDSSPERFEEYYNLAFTIACGLFPDDDKLLL